MTLTFKAAAVVFAFSTSAASACQYADCWGAVGVGPGGAAGWTFNYGSEGAALNRLYSECPSCDKTYTFVNSCGSIAMDAQGAWGSGWGTSRDLAEFYAIDTCEGYSSIGGCRAIVWACND